MPNYMNQLVPSNTALNQGTNALAGALQLKQAQERNQLAANQDQRDAQRFEIEKMSVPMQFIQMKSSHLAGISKNLMGLPREQRTAKYNDMITKVAAMPIAESPQFGQLGVVPTDEYLQPDEFAKLTDDQQMSYLKLVAYDSDAIAKLDLTKQRGFLEAQKIQQQHEAKINEIKAGKVADIEEYREKGEVDIRTEREKSWLRTEEERAKQIGRMALKKEEGRQEKFKIEKDVEKFGQGVFSQEEIELMGATYNLKGTLPSLGRGKEATAMRHRILQSAARQALDTGQDAGDVVAGQSDVKAISQSLNMQEKQYGAMGSFVNNLHAQIKKVKELSKEFKTFDTRLLNVPLRTVRGRLVGSPLQARYDMYLTEIESEIGKLATGSSASVSELSVEAQKKWDRIHDKNLSVNDMISLLEETKMAGEMRLKSVEDQLAVTRQRLRSVGEQPIQTEATPTGQLQPDHTQQAGPAQNTAEGFLQSIRAGSLWIKKRK